MISFLKKSNGIYYIVVAKRKPGFFGKFKKGDNFNRMNTGRILRIKI